MTIVVLLTFSLTPFAYSDSSFSRNRGISTIFVKRLECLTEDDPCSPPLEADIAVKNLSRYGAIWCANYIPNYGRSIWNLFREQHPEILTLYYRSAITSRKEGGNYFDYDYIHTNHPEWFLLNDIEDPSKADPRVLSNRIRWNIHEDSEYYNRFYLDVCNEDFQKWAAGQILYCVSGEKQNLDYPYDGWGADNASFGTTRMSQLTRRHPNWQYAHDLNTWNEGLFAFLKTVRTELHKHGFILVANQPMNYRKMDDVECWDPFLASTDGALTEKSLRYNGLSGYYSRYWLDSIEKHEKILDEGVIDWWACYPPDEPPKEGDPCGHDAFMYTYCSWLMVKQPGRSFYHARNLLTQPGSEGEAAWYAEYDLPIGDPISTRYAGNNCWLRNYTGAIVVVNSTKAVQEVIIDTEKPWWDWTTKKYVSALEMPLKSGRILFPALAVNAGPDQIVTDYDGNGSELITLEGSATTHPEGNITDYLWYEGANQIAGGATPTLVLPVGPHVITLEVTNNDGFSATDTVTITINKPADQPPVADAGPDQTVIDYDRNGSEQVTLDGSGSKDPNGMPFLPSVFVVVGHHSFAWSEGGKQIATGEIATVTLATGQHIITLTVTDDSGKSATDTVTITVIDLDNQMPVARAGPDQTITDADGNGSEPVTLDGSGSDDPDGTIESYVWSEGDHQLATGVSANVMLTTGRHTIVLNVTDDGNLTAADTVIVTINEFNHQPQAPAAGAGPDQTVIDADGNGSEPVTLDGSGSSDPDGTIESYVWSEEGIQLATGENANVVLALGEHRITLTVTDNDGLSATDMVTITINKPADQPPVANAGPDQIITDADGNGSEPVTLDGSGSSDPDGTIQSYRWSEDGNQIATGVNPAVTLGLGRHTITLTVTDNSNLTASDTVTITINRPVVTHTITATAGGAGLIEPAGEVQVTDGADQQFNVTPDTGYSIVNILVDGISQGIGTSFTFNCVTTDHTISVIFMENIDNTDKTAPIVTNCSPYSDAIQAPLNTLIILQVADAGDGVDANFVEIRVEDALVYAGGAPDYISEHGRCLRKGTKAGYIFTYQPAEVFDFDQTVNITVNARDLDGNIMPEYSSSFKTQMRSFGGNTKVSSDNTTLPQDNPATVQDSGGNVWVVWEAGPVGSRNIYIGKRPVGASAFESSMQITNAVHDQCNPTITVDKDDKLYLAWQDKSRGNWNIFFSTSRNGVNWSTATQITDSKTSQFDPAIAVDYRSAPQVYIVWRDNRNANQDIYIAVSDDDFLTKTTIPLTTNQSDQTEPAIAVDADNVVYVLWTTQAKGGSTDIYGAALHNGSWIYKAIVNNDYNQSAPAIAAESEGNILHLLWVDDTSGNRDIYYAATAGGLPESHLTGINIVDDSSGADQTQPAIIIRGFQDNNLKVFACWRDERNIHDVDRDSDIYFAEAESLFGVNIWVADDNAANADQYHPVIGMDVNGHPYIVWVDAGAENTRIHYAGSTAINTELLDKKKIIASQDNIVGADPDNIDSEDDVCLQIPAGAFWDDVEVTISRVDNPPSTALLSPMKIISQYEFGPSSNLEFSKPVTITIPYYVADAGNESVYWYNPQTGEFSQSGIANIEIIVISDELHAIRYTTTHFTQFAVAQEAGAEPSLGSGFGGGCSMSGYDPGPGGIIEFLLPYLILFLVLRIAKYRAASRG